MAELISVYAIITSFSSLSKGSGPLSDQMTIESASEVERCRQHVSPWLTESDKSIGPIVNWMRLFNTDIVSAMPILDRFILKDRSHKTF